MSRKELDKIYGKDRGNSVGGSYNPTKYGKAKAEIDDIKIMRAIIVASSIAFTLITAGVVHSLIKDYEEALAAVGYTKESKNDIEAIVDSYKDMFYRETPIKRVHNDKYGNPDPNRFDYDEAKYIISDKLLEALQDQGAEIKFRCVLLGASELVKKQYREDVLKSTLKTLSQQLASQENKEYNVSEEFLKCISSGELDQYLKFLGHENLESYTKNEEREIIKAYGMSKKKMPLNETNVEDLNEIIDDGGDIVYNPYDGTIGRGMW